jgi:hypothetical protein
MCLCKSEWMRLNAHTHMITRFFFTFSRISVAKAGFLFTYLMSLCRGACFAGCAPLLSVNSDITDT